jgi:hypothetical protein
MTQTPHAPVDHSSTPPPIGEPQVDRTRPQPARRYDYWLGGKDNFEADRTSGDRIAEAFPTIRTAVIENRRFLVRVVRHLAARGIHQFLDIGTGLPTSPNVHEVAQAIAPACRVVYVAALRRRAAATSRTTWTSASRVSWLIAATRARAATR